MESSRPTGNPGPEDTAPVSLEQRPRFRFRSSNRDRFRFGEVRLRRDPKRPVTPPWHPPLFSIFRRPSGIVLHPPLPRLPLFPSGPLYFFFFFFHVPLFLEAVLSALDSVRDTPPLLKMPSPPSPQELLIQFALSFPFP